MTSDRSPQYRADIDGLRAVAVLAVLASHAGIPFMAGGYVGVDVFFVISGYLITGLILADLDRGQFSFRTFYLRRVRRIIPALLLVLTGTYALGFFILGTKEMWALADSIVATIFFVPNILFSNQVSYFEVTRNLKPLLMTWSLGVEEQFYLLFPLILVLTRRIRIPAPVVILGLGGASFAFALWLTPRNPTDAYYLLTSRAWELLVGASLVIVGDRMGWIERSAPLARNAFGWAGAGLILASVTLYDEQSLFPSWRALAPCVGAALLILAGRGAAFNRIVLASAPFVFVGSISYSLYLWHWPLISYAHHLFAADVLPPVVAATALLMAGLLATGSTYLLEMPIRHRPMPAKAREVLALAGCAFLVAAVAGWTADQKGLTARVKMGWVVDSEERLQEHQGQRIEKCYLKVDYKDVGSEPTCVSKRTGPHTLLVWGDSISGALAPGFDRWAEQNNFTFGQFTLGGCPPLAKGYLLGARMQVAQQNCARFNADALAYVLAHPEVRVVVLSANWANFTGEENSRDSFGRITKAGDSEESLERTRTHLSASLEQLTDILTKAGRLVVLVGPVPDLSFHPRKCWASKLKNPLGLTQSLECDEGIERVLRRVAFADSMVERAAAKSAGACSIYPTKVFCDATKCRTKLDSYPLYIDSLHVSHAGARRIVGSPEGSACLQKVGASP